MSELVTCLNKEGAVASLIAGRVYRTLPNTRAAGHHLIRVLDEDRSEPDGYPYPATLFARVGLTETARQALTALAAAKLADLVLLPARAAGI